MNAAQKIAVAVTLAAMAVLLFVGAANVARPRFSPDEYLQLKLLEARADTLTRPLSPLDSLRVERLRALDSVRYYSPYLVGQLVVVGIGVLVLGSAAVLLLGIKRTKRSQDRPAGPTP